MGKKHHDDEMVVCPVGRFFMDLEKTSAKKSKFFVHLDRSRVEFLMAIRSLIDDKIDHLETKEASRSGKKLNTIRVE